MSQRIPFLPYFPFYIFGSVRLTIQPFVLYGYQSVPRHKVVVFFVCTELLFDANDIRVCYIPPIFIFVTLLKEGVCIAIGAIICLYIYISILCYSCLS